MSTERTTTLPVTAYLTSWGIFERYQEHVKKLEVTARGDVLIIGPGLQEIGLIEPAISRGDVRSLTLIGENPISLEPILTICRENHPIPLEASSLSLGMFFDFNPSKTFDTIMYLGRPKSLHFEELLRELATHLNPMGGAYLTMNYFPDLPPVPTIPGCQLEILPEMPPNPNYDDLGRYLGVVLHKTPLSVAK